MATLALASLFTTQPVHAAEITPSPSSYSYGSTSEISAAAQPDSSPITSYDSLAPSGVSQRQGELALVGLLVVAGVSLLCVLGRAPHTCE